MSEFVQRPRRPEDFDAYYAGTPPWDIGRPQGVFQALADAGDLRGAVLDAGCGTGEHALLAAGLGLPATGVDSSAVAIALAEGKARDRGLAARFLVGDALALTGAYDTVLDCGLFHIFDDADRARYAASLAAVVVPGGTYHLLCFSDEEPGDFGPRRVTRAEIRASFADGWRIEAIEAVRLETTFGPEGSRAWHATITRN